jgi:hypothetical protein
MISATEATGTTTATAIVPAAERPLEDAAAVVVAGAVAALVELVNPLVSDCVWDDWLAVEVMKIVVRCVVEADVTVDTDVTVGAVVDVVVGADVADVEVVDGCVVVVGTLVVELVVELDKVDDVDVVDVDMEVDKLDVVDGGDDVEAGDAGGAEVVPGPMGFRSQC